MKVNENLLSGVFVQRETQPVVEQSVVQYEELEGLPFYYSFNTSLSYLLIIFGVLLLIGQIFLVLFGSILPFCLRKFICTKCRKTMIKFNNPERCPVCGGKVVPIKDYESNKLDKFDNRILK